MTPQFAFFWIGDDLSIPSMLVKSIRHIYRENAYIFHLTDLKTKNINDVNETLRAELPQPIMLARLKAYSLIKTKNPTIFLDADSLIINNVSLPDFGKYKSFFVKRNDSDLIINHNFPEYYPEFEGKKLIDIMPVLFGFIATPNGGNIFSELLTLAETLPERFHRWYGDQIALKQIWERNKSDYLLLKQDEYLFVTKSALSKFELKKLIENKTTIITFKGPRSKQFIPETFNELVHE